MTVCAKTAVRAFRLVEDGLSAEDAWKRAICEFTDSKHYQKKNCPKVAFCGLISSDSKWDNKDNAIYAQRALSFLKKHPRHKFKNKELWEMIGNSHKHHDGQMDVVLALWNNN